MIAGAIVVLGAAIAAWWLWPDASTPVVADGDGAVGRRIKEVTPAPAPKSVSPTPVVGELPGHVVEYKKVGKNSIMKYVDGEPAWMCPREDYHGPVHTSSTARVDTIVEKTFQHEADRTIAGLLLIDPGDTVIGEIEYDEAFVKAFLESYDNPFMVMPEDTDEQKALKHSVADIKGELRQRMDAGEDIGKILTEARNQLQELGAYKDEINAMVEEIAEKSAKTPEDIEDAVNAANKMLESRGIAPMKIRGFLRGQMRRLANKTEEE